MKKYLVIFFLLNILINNTLLAKDSIQLNIKVKEVNKEEMICDFTYSFNLKKNENAKTYVLFLPFKENPNLTFSLLNDNPELYFTHGFSNNGSGIALFNSRIEKDLVFKVEFHEIILPLKKITSETNGLMVNIDIFFDKKPYPFETPQCNYLNINNIIIETKSILDSKPKFELSDKGAGFYNINLIQNNGSVYFIIPFPPESYISIFLICIVIAILGGILSAVRIIQGRNQSMWGFGLSSICLAILIYLFFNKIIPTDFNKDLDMIGLIGGGIGFSFGIFLNSGYNLIVFRTINQQQSLTSS